MTGGGRRGGAITWVAATAVLVAGALLYSLGPDHDPLEVSDRSGLVSMLTGVLALVVAVIALLWTRPGSHEDEAAAVARLARAVRSVGEPRWMHSLGGDLTAVDVTFTFRPYANARAAALPPTPAGQLERVVEDYRALRPRRLVITGESGAGKTVLAWKIVMELNRTRREGEPVPVLMALADWDAEESVGDWIARHLESDYGLPRRSARKVVEARMVLPVLDGLDEMGTDVWYLPERRGLEGRQRLPRRGLESRQRLPAFRSRAHAALAALARYQDGTDPAPLVLTCRTGMYDALEADAHHILDAARIEIAPVTAEQAVRFLALRGAARRPVAWQPVLAELRNAPDGVLSRTLSTPWRLTLLATAYEREGDPEELLHPRTEDEKADLLLHRYIPAAVSAAQPAPGSCAAPEAHRRLGVLARALTSGGRAETDLRLPELSRRLGGRRPRALLCLLIVVCAAAAIPVMFLTASRPSFGDVIPMSVATAAPSLAMVLSRRVREGIALSWYMPRPGSSLWRVGMRLALKVGMRGWELAVLALLLLGCVALAAPRGVGGFGEWQVALSSAPAFLTVLAIAATGWIDVAAVGPSGWARGGIVAAVGAGSTLAGIGAVGLLADRGWGDIAPTMCCLLACPCLAVGSHWMEYGILVLLESRLPFRLARFLDWTVTAGLMRVSGATYQFRHREFQEWLVRHPEPVG